MLHREEHQGFAIRQLQGLKTATVAGALAATNIALAGAKTTDHIVSVIEYAAGVPTDRTAEASIPTDGNLQLSTTDTSGDTLVVMTMPMVGSA